MPGVIQSEAPPNRDREVLDGHALLERRDPRPVNCLSLSENHGKGVNIRHPGNRRAFGDRPAEIDAYAPSLQDGAGMRL